MFGSFASFSREQKKSWKCQKKQKQRTIKRSSGLISPSQTTGTYKARIIKQEIKSRKSASIYASIYNIKYNAVKTTKKRIFVKFFFFVYFLFLLFIINVYARTRVIESGLSVPIYRGRLFFCSFFCKFSNFFTFLPRKLF